MAANTKNVAVAATGGQASASFADIVNFSYGGGDSLMIDNHSTTVGLYVRWATRGGTATTPTSGGDDCYYIPPGAFRVFPITGVSQVKLIGDAATSSYSVAVI